jgi:predicted GTPase
MNAMSEDEQVNQNLILVMGLTGAGKTYFINQLTGENLQVGTKLVSCN